MTDAPPSKFSKVFSEMADRVNRTPETEFSGAMVIVPPEGEPIAVLLNDPKKDLAAFLSLANAKIEIAVSELQQKTAQPSAFGRR